MANIKSFPNNQDVYIGAEEVMRWLHGRTSGVFAAAGNAAVAALASPGMAVTVTDGTGWMSNNAGNGIVWWNDTQATTGALLQLTVDIADAALSRIDRVVVDWKTTNYVAYPEIKILKGAPAGSPTAPALTNNSTTRQISLARISVPAGCTEITASMITDERLDKNVCGLVTDWLTVDTTTMQAQFSAYLKRLQDELSQLEAGTAVELKKLLFSSVSVAASAWATAAASSCDGVRTKYANVSLSGVTADMVPQVTFWPADIEAWNLSPIVKAIDGGIQIYAETAPTNAITIGSILCWRG